MWLLLSSQQIWSGNSEEKERVEPKRSRSQKSSFRQLPPAKIQGVQTCYCPVWGWSIGPKTVTWEKLRMQKTVNLQKTMAVRMLVFKKAVISSPPAQAAVLAGFTVPGCFIPHSTGWVGVRRTHNKELRSWSLFAERTQDFTAQN